MSEHTAVDDHKPDDPSFAVVEQRRSRRLVRLLGLGLVLVIVTGAAALGLWLRFGHGGVSPLASQAGRPAWQRPVVTEAGLIGASGVRIAQVAVTGGGGLVDLRFQVADPDKAGTLHDAATPPVILDEATGLVVDQLLMGHSHNSPFKAGVTYYLIFENPGNLVQPGSKVSVLLGNAEVDHVEVQ